MSASMYVSKHAFAGNLAQSQLTFPAGATIAARTGQEGKAWWWGSYQGREGWFPPAYVTPASAGVASPAGAVAPGGAQRMQQATFTSSVQRMQQQKVANQFQQGPVAQQQQPSMSMMSGGAQHPNVNPFSPSASASFGQMSQPPQQQTGGFGAMSAAGIDPFAGLDSTPSIPSMASGGGVQQQQQPVTTTTAMPPMQQQPIQQKPMQQQQTIASNSFPVSSSTPVSATSSSNLTDVFQGMSVTSTPVASAANASATAHASRGQSAVVQQQRTPQRQPPTALGTSANASPPRGATGGISPAERKMADQAQKKMIQDQARAKNERLREEAEQRKAREAAEKAQRKEMARQKKQQSFEDQARLASAQGVGSSGVRFSVQDTAVGGGGMSLSPASAGFFNPYCFLAGADAKEPTRKFNPIYRVQPFLSLMKLDRYIRRSPPDEKDMETPARYEQLAKALSFVCHIVQENHKFVPKGREATLSFLRANQLGCEAGVKLISLLPHSAGASGKSLDGLFLNFINVFVSLVENIQPHQQIVLPGGWQQPDHTHICLYIVRNCGDDKFSFTVCNTGRDGLDYHPCKFDEDSGKQKRQLAMTIWDIPAVRVRDSTFWVLLFRMQVYPHKRNNAEFLYTKLLPALNDRPLMANLEMGTAEYHEVPDAIAATTYVDLARLALTSTPVTGSRPSSYVSLLLMNAAVEMSYQSIADAAPSSLDPEDTRILKLTGRNLANYGSTIDPSTVPDGTLGASLSFTWDLLDRLLKKINFASAKPMDQHAHGLAASARTDSFSKGAVTSLQGDPGAAAHPFFGRLRRDDYENVVKGLMGEPRKDPILVPSILTDENLPGVATNYQEAGSILLRVCNACSLLMQQRELVKNAPAFVSSAAQHALTSALPLPGLDKSRCFWRKTGMRRETQLNLLFLIRRICTIYSAATACVQQSRGLVAIRTTAFGCAACIADAITRVKAIDDPGPFSLHYSGDCEGPTEAFGIEAGSFESLAASLPIFDPHYTSLRFQCLDYMRGICVKKDGSERPTIFNFDQSLKPMKGDITLTNQLSIQLALPRPNDPTGKADLSHSSALISGVNGAIMEVLPEFEYFRDIIFHFKHSVSGKSPTPENTPENYTWKPSEATLKWTTQPTSNDDATPVYRVTAFRGHHQDFVDPETIKKKAGPFRAFLSFFGRSAAERSKLSCADPTNIVNTCAEKFRKGKNKPIQVKNEDDILHLDVKELPTFDSVLSASDAERFLQFMTAPYIRIPLILDFFANGDPGRLAALKSKSLQLIVDASLFEPGNWRSADYMGAVTEIPVVDEDKLQALLSTPMGTLFNEVAKSPDVLTSCVVKILDRALDMDVGKYSQKSTSGPLILYAVRLAVRVEGFMKFALEKCAAGKHRPRGLESLDSIKIASSLKKIRKILDEQAFPTLEYWIDPSRTKHVNTTNLVHAHLLYMFKNYDYEEFDFRAVSVLLSSQVYLMINHRFSNKIYDDLADTSDPTKPPPSIQLSQTEVFDVIQNQRQKIMKYMKEKPEEGSDAMEAVVRISTGTGTRTKYFDNKIQKSRKWKSIQHPTCYGRFVPDTEDEQLRGGGYRVPKEGENYEQWMLRVTTKAVGIEVNAQISEFTLQNHKMALLDPHVMNDPDFKHLRKEIAPDASDVACAEVMHTSNRYWWRLVGRRYDVMSWAPDGRNYHDFKEGRSAKLTRKFPNKLRGGESWVADALLEKLPLILPGVTLFMGAEDVSNAPYVQLAGWIENPRGGESVSTHTLKEVVVWQNPPVINIFNVKEHGRRMFRVLEYTSNMSLCLHEVPGEPYPDRVAGILALSAGIPMTSLEPAPSLLITRALNSKLGTQLFIPQRFLAGILPTALVEAYSFWQSSDDNIIGYLNENIAEDDDNDEVEVSTPVLSGPSTRLNISLFKGSDMDKSGFCNSQAEALVQRIPVLDANHTSEEIDPSRPKLSLLNVMTATPMSLLKRIGMLLSRLDNLSHVLIWSTANVRTAHEACSIDVVELPRVNLSFKSKKVEAIDGKVDYRLYSNDHSGLFISTSTESREIAERLLGSIAHFIVLQNSDNDLFVLVPGCALPRRLNVDSSHLSVQVVLDRRNQEWIDNMGEVKCYLYPVHNSKSFLVTPSLASSMYLMVMYFITGSYRDVFKMVESCVSEELSAEELQIFNQLEFLGNDMHPDAHACRLKLSAVTVGLGGEMKCPWSIEEEMIEYVRKSDFVSSACRLTPQEELLLLRLGSVNSTSKPPLILLNRRAFVTAVSSVYHLPPDKSLTVNLGAIKSPDFADFDNGADKTIIENPRQTMVTSKIFGAAYSRPEEDQVAYGGLRALEYINSALNSGVEVTSGHYGFPLMYDLLVGTVAFKLHPSDRTHNWGRLLVRIVPPSDFTAKSAEMSILRTLADNPAVACNPNIPKFSVDSTMNKFKGMFQGKDAVSRLVTEVHDFLVKESIKSMLFFPRTHKVALSQTAVVLRRPTSASEHRLWVVPQINDYSQEVFHLDIQNCSSVNIPLAQLQAFAMKPLAPVKLESFVQFLSLNQRRLPLVSSAVPFDISHERASKTHCSEATMQRISADMRKYAEKENAGTTPTLIGFAPADIDALHGSPPAMSKAQNQLTALVRSLNSSMDFDRKSLSNLMHRALAIVNSDERSDTPYASGVVGECNFLRFRLGQCSEREPSAWFELLVASILSTTSDSDIRSLNPYLTASAYKTVMSLTIVAMLTSIRIGQTHRVLTG